MKTMRWTTILGLALGLLILTGPLATFSPATASNATLIEFRSPT